MKTFNYFSRTFSAIRNFRTKRDNLLPPTNELIHPRFGMTPTDGKAEKKTPNSLLFLMYSKENENLFI